MKVRRESKGISPRVGDSTVKKEKENSISSRCSSGSKKKSSNSYTYIIIISNIIVVFVFNLLIYSFIYIAHYVYLVMLVQVI